jgi:hypothetical protein
MRVSGGCLYFIGILTASLRGSPIASLIFLKILGIETSTTNLGVITQGDVMLQLPGEIDKELEAKKIIIKLMLLRVRGGIDIDSTSITNINPASPVRGMQVALNQPRTARTSQFVDLVWMTLDLAK